MQRIRMMLGFLSPPTVYVIGVGSCCLLALLVAFLWYQAHLAQQQTLQNITTLSQQQIMQVSDKLNRVKTVLRQPQHNITDSWQNTVTQLQEIYPLVISESITEERQDASFTHTILASGALVHLLNTIHALLQRQPNAQLAQLHINKTAQQALAYTLVFTSYEKTGLE